MGFLQIRSHIASQLFSHDLSTNYMTTSIAAGIDDFSLLFVGSLLKYKISNYLLVLTSLQPFWSFSISQLFFTQAIY